MIEAMFAGLALVAAATVLGASIFEAGRRIGKAEAKPRGRYVGSRGR